MDVNAVIASAFKGAGLVQASPVKAPKARVFPMAMFIFNKNAAKNQQLHLWKISMT